MKKKKKTKMVQLNKIIYCIFCGNKLSINAYYTNNRRCRECFYKQTKGRTRNVSKRNRISKAKLMSKNRKSGLVNTWNKNMNMRKERPELVQKMIIALKGRRCNKLGEFKKGHKLGMKHRKNLINKHHIDLNHQNNAETNLIFIKNSIHNSLHKRAYDFLVKINKIDDYINWFFNDFNKEAIKYTYEESKKINKQLTREEGENENK